MKKANGWQLGWVVIWLVAQTASAWFGAKPEPTATPQPQGPESVLARQMESSQTGYDTMLRQLESTLRAARERVEALKSEEKALDKELKTTEKNIAVLKQTNEERLLQLEEQQTKLSEIEQMVLAKSERINELLNAVQAEKKLQGLESALAKQTSDMEALKAEGKRLAELHDTERNRMIKDMEALKQETMEQKTALEQLKAQWAAEQKNNETLRKTEAALLKRIADMEQAMKTLEEEKQKTIESLAASLRDFEQFISTQAAGGAKKKK